MRYVGGKSRIAGKLSAAILATTDERETYLEPFLGGGAMFAAMASHFDTAHASDNHPDVAALWHAVLAGGWRPPSSISREQYADIKSDPAASALRGFAGFGSSFGGKFFGGYSPGDKGDGAATSARSILKDAARIGNRVSIDHCDYREWSPLPCDVVYCDPPYAGTTGYSTGGFDSARFWWVMEEWRDRGAHVFVSEYQPPSRLWPAILELGHISTLDQKSNNKPTVERLFYRAP